MQDPAFSALYVVDYLEQLPGRTSVCNILLLLVLGLLSSCLVFIQKIIIFKVMVDSLDCGMEIAAIDVLDF